MSLPMTPYLWPDVPLQGKRVVLQGDPFLLTIPPADAWHDFYNQVHESPAYAMTNRQLKGMFAAFLVRKTGDKDPVMEYKKFWTDPLTNQYKRSPIGFVSKRPGENPSFSFNVYRDENFNTLYFRPCLIPLTQDGRIDLLREPNGTKFFGGYLQMTCKARATTSVRVYGQASEQDQSIIPINENCEDLTIVDNPPASGTVNKGDQLMWWSVNGCLVLTWNFGTTDPDDLWRLGLLPTV